LSNQPAFCPKCGAARDPGAAFCSKCGTSFTTTSAPPGTTAPPMDWREQRRQWRAQRRAEQHEKSEKGEKGEKPEKAHGDLTGAVVGGGILIWLGLLVYFQAVHVISGNDTGGFFLMGIGVLIVIGGLVAHTSSGRPLFGYLIGGLVAIVLGAFALTGFTTYIGALFLVFLGLLVIVFAVSARRRSPAPSSPAPM
jgi:zinc ribbon protein